MDLSTMKKTGYIPVDRSTATNHPSEARNRDGSLNSSSRNSKPFGWTKIPYLSKFSVNPVMVESTKPALTLSSDSILSEPGKYNTDIPTQVNSETFILDNHPASVNIQRAGGILPWSCCVWKSSDYQNHATSPVEFLVWSSRNNLAETCFHKISRMGLLVLDQHVLHTQHPSHMQKESARQPASFFVHASSANLIHDEDDDEVIDEELTLDNDSGKQVYPTRYFIPNSSYTSHPYINGIECMRSPINPMRSPYEMEHGWNEYEEWYANTYHHFMGSPPMKGSSSDRVDLSDVRLKGRPCARDSSYAIIQSKRIASTIFTYSAVSASPISPVNDIICLNSEHLIYLCDIGLTNSQCDLIIHTAERCANGTYAAYTYAKQTLGCRDYDALGLVCEWPVLKVCSTINKYLENPEVNDGDKSQSTMSRKRILALDDREPHIVKYDVSRKERQKLDMHTDKSEWTFIIALSEGRGKDYDCGGTYIEVIDSTIHLQRGQVLIFPGKLRHRGQKITKGVRYLLVGFMVDKSMDPSLTSHR